MKLIPQSKTRHSAMFFPRPDGWYMHYRVWGPKKRLLKFQSRGPTASIFDLEALIDNLDIQERPEIRYLSRVTTEKLAAHDHPEPVTYTLLGGAHYGLQGIPGEFMVSRYRDALFIYDPRTCIYLCRREGRLHAGPSFFWSGPEGGEPFRLSSPIPTSAADWEALTLRTAVAALEHGCTYDPVILTGLERQPWTPSWIQSA